MAVKVINLGLIDDQTILVEFSDLSYAAFTVEELLKLQRSKKTSQAPEPEGLPN